MAGRLQNLIATIPLLAFLPGPSVTAQEVGAFFLGSSSRHVELPAPAGFSGSLLVEHWANWHFLVSAYRVEDATDKEGLVCLTSPATACRPEAVHTAVSLAGLRGGLIRSVDVGELLRVGAGAGLSFNSLDTESIGTSGRPSNLLSPNGGQIGVFGVLMASVRPFPAVPARLVGRFNTHWINFSSCSGEEPPQYDPFCRPETFREFEVGLSYAF